MSSQGVCSSIFPLKYRNMEASCGDTAMFAVSAAGLVFGILIAAGVMSTGNQGVILPGVNFGAAAEGGTLSAMAAIVMSVTVARICSPRVRGGCLS